MNRLRYRTGGVIGIALLALLTCSMEIRAAVHGAGSLGITVDSTAADGRAATGSAAAYLAQTDSAAAEDASPIWTIEDLDSILTKESGADISEKATWKRSKNARVAMLCALIFPGLGQIYNEKPYKAALVVGVETFYLGNILLNYRYAEREEFLRGQSIPGTTEWRDHDLMTVYYKERMIDWIWWSAGAMLIIVLDAYIDAHLHDMKFEVEGRGLEDGAGLSIGFAF